MSHSSSPDPASASASDHKPVDHPPQLMPEMTTIGADPHAANHAAKGSDYDSNHQSSGWLGHLWGVVFRSGLLVMSGGVALVVGGAIATHYPADINHPPLLEQILQYLDTMGGRKD